MYVTQRHLSRNGEVYYVILKTLLEIQLLEFIFITIILISKLNNHMSLENIIPIGSHETYVWDFLRVSCLILTKSTQCVMTIDLI